MLEPPERLLPGGEHLIKIGEEVSEHFDYRPASIVRVRVVRPKYRRAPQSTNAPSVSPIVIAELPERPIPRSVAGPGLIAHVITRSSQTTCRCIASKSSSNGKYKLRGLPQRKRPREPASPRRGGRRRAKGRFVAERAGLAAATSRKCK
ncbi:MAG: IS66 family transposase zinc-finger binding domain-containing protein [Polyangiaceae bacterium]|nr:IS66 family transposase zinc-finger binding domain-containing protein [Polyangiaceae bacterium]